MSRPFVMLAAATLCVAAPLAAQHPAHVDSTSSLRDSLGRTPVRLKDVTVQAAPARRDEPVSAVRVTPEVIGRTPSLDAWDLLRQTAGIQANAQGQGAGFANDATLRGFSSDHSTDLALYIDGVPNNEPINGHAEGYNDLNILMPQALQDVEVLKGPTSALYGNFAMAGTVSVRTLERMSGVRASLDGGAYGRLDGSLLTGVDRPELGAVIGIRGVREGGWRPNSGFRQGQLFARIVRRLSDAATLDASATGLALGWEAPGVLSLADYEARNYQIAGDVTDGGTRRRAQERVSLRVLAGSNLLWRTTIFATQGRWKLLLDEAPAGGLGEGSGSQTEELDRRHGWGATSALTWAGARAEVTGGLVTRLDYATFDNYFTTAGVRDSVAFLADARQASVGAFAQSNLDLSRHLRLSLGGRYDRLSTRSTQPGAGTLTGAHDLVSPKLGALYHIAGVGAVYTNVSRGFRQTDGVIRDPSLGFIDAWNYEAGLKLDALGVTASAAVFQVDVSNEQTFNPITQASTSGGRSRRRGVELELAAALAPAVRFSSTATFVDARYRDAVTQDEEGNTVDLSGLRVFNTARVYGAAALDVSRPGAPWMLRAATNFIGAYSPFDEPGVVTGGYALVHLTGTYRIGSQTLQLSVRNLFNTAYAELRAGGLVAPGQPRSVFGGWRVAL